ncbi:hypothetical protein MAM1_0070d04121 [Mucor ambiguus]|uniref:Uncharacterized protein n=1 Tax=Mucor ambiguus TaxID=91626 RepID=A0A0C9LUA0_9FUNG|nr:hypothetical protein MAM1_0070d04121 [Mucor ambiguus]
MHLRRSNCGEQHEQQQRLRSQSQASTSSTVASSNPLIALPLLITVENLFAIFVNVPNFINHAESFLMILCGYVNAFVDVPGIFSSIYCGCMFFWTLCTDPDNISTPCLPNSIQPYWDSVYDYLNIHVVYMAIWSGRLFNAWSFLVTPIRMDPEAIYTTIQSNPSLSSWMKAVLIRLGKVVELLIGSYVLNKVLLWSFNALVVCILFIYLGLKEIVLGNMN